jgi:hypothetical protein
VRIPPSAAPKEWSAAAPPTRSRVDSADWRMWAKNAPASRVERPHPDTAMTISPRAIPQAPSPKVERASA